MRASYRLRRENAGWTGWRGRLSLRCNRGASTFSCYHLNSRGAYVYVYNEGSRGHPGRSTREFVPEEAEEAQTKRRDETRRGFKGTSPCMRAFRAGADAACMKPPRGGCAGRSWQTSTRNSKKSETPASLQVQAMCNSPVARNNQR